MTLNQDKQDDQPVPFVHDRYGRRVTEEDKAGRFMINEYRLVELNSKIEKLNRRAVKLGVPKLSVAVDRNDPIIRYLDPDLGKYGPVRVYYLCSIEGSAPRDCRLQLGCSV